MTPADAIELFMLQIHALSDEESERYDRAILAWNMWSAVMPEEAATIMHMIIEVTRLAGDQDTVETD